MDEVSGEMDRKPSTVRGYLAEFVRRDNVTDASPWVEPDVIRRVQSAVAQVGGERLKPIFDKLGGQVSDEDIRIVVECWKNSAQNRSQDHTAARSPPIPGDAR